MARKKCLVCRKIFEPDKWHPYQKVCFNNECRGTQRILSLQKWRIKNPDYFKQRTDNLDKMQEWRKANPNYYIEYRRAHPELRDKTQKYVREFRKRKREASKQKQNLVDKY